MLATQYFQPKSALLLLLPMSMLLVQCAPERAKAIRDDKSLTLGLPGATFRPTGKVGVGATFNSVTGDSSTIDTSKNGPSALVTKRDDSAPENLRDLKTTYAAVNPYVQFFPFDTSAFFVGFGGSYRRSTYRYQEDQIGHTALAPMSTGVKYETTDAYLAIPVGWAWIWENGFSIQLDVGPTFRVSHSGNAVDGESSNVDETKRDQTLKTIDDLEKGQMSLGLARSLIGWSF